MESFTSRLSKCVRIAIGVVVPALSQGQAADCSGWLLASSHLIFMIVFCCVLQ